MSLQAAHTRKKSRSWQDWYNAFQPTCSKKRGHKNVEIKRENVKEKEEREGRRYYICIVRNYIPTAENAKPGCSAGSVASGHTVHGQGMGVADFCYGASRTANLIP